MNKKKRKKTKIETKIKYRENSTIMSKSLEIKNNKIRRRKVSWSKKGPTFVRTIVIPNAITKVLEEPVRAEQIT